MMYVLDSNVWINTNLSRMAGWTIAIGKIGEKKNNPRELRTILQT